MQYPARSPLMDRLKYGAYGLTSGLVVGLFLGWMFHGFVGALVRAVIILIIMVPFVMAIAFWFKVNQQNRDARSSIQEAEWRDASETTFR